MTELELYKDRYRKTSTELAQMKGDVRTFISVIGGLAQNLGIDIESLKDPNFDLLSGLPQIMMKVSVKMSSGMQDTQGFANLKELSPILEKYSELIPDELKGKESEVKPTQTPNHGKSTS